MVLDASWSSLSLPTISLLPVMALGVGWVAASVEAVFEPAPAAALLAALGLAALVLAVFEPAPAALLLAALGLAPPILAEVWTLPPALAVV